VNAASSCAQSLQNQPKNKEKDIAIRPKISKTGGFFFLRWLVAIAKQRRLMQTTK
jgi:hypothetical protein